MILRDERKSGLFKKSIKAIFAAVKSVAAEISDGTVVTALLRIRSSVLLLARYEQGGDVTLGCSSRCLLFRDIKERDVHVPSIARGRVQRTCSFTVPSYLLNVALNAQSGLICQ